MKYNIEIGQSADEDLSFYEVFEQRIIVKAIIEYLQLDANVETRKRKRLRSNPVAPWELRIGDFRAFYEINANRNVKILAIGHKVHNELFIRRKKVEI